MTTSPQAPGSLSWAMAAAVTGTWSRNLNQPDHIQNHVQTRAWPVLPQAVLPLLGPRGSGHLRSSRLTRPSSPISRPSLSASKGRHRERGTETTQDARLCPQAGPATRSGEVTATTKAVPPQSSPLGIQAACAL